MKLDERGQSSCCEDFPCVQMKNFKFLVKNLLVNSFLESLRPLGSSDFIVKEAFGYYKGMWALPSLQRLAW